MSGKIFCLPVILLLYLSVGYVSAGDFVTPSIPEIETTALVVTSQNDMDYRIDVIEEEIQDLIQKMDELQRENPKRFDEVMEKTTNNTFLISISNRITLPPRCAELILRNDFEKAREVLDLIYFNNYEDVIFEAFQNESENFQQLMRFADTLKDDNKFVMYYELFKEGQREYFDNITDYMQMVSNIKQHDSVKWIWFEHEVLDFIIEKIIEYIVSDDFEAEPDITDVSKLYNLDNSAGFKLVSSAIKTLSLENNMTLAFDFIFRQEVIPLRIQGFDVAIDFIYENADFILNYYALFKVGVMMRQTKEDPQIDEKSKSELVRIQEKLPKSVRIALFSKEVCIYNKKSGNYLKSIYEKDKTSGTVIVSNGDTSYDRTKWAFQPVKGSIVNITSVYRKQFLGIKTDDPAKFSIEISNAANFSYDIVGLAVEDDLNLMMNVNFKFLCDYEGVVLAKDIGDISDFCSWIVERC